MFKGWVILIAVAICYSFAGNAQSLRGKLIYVSSSQPVKLKFGSRITNYSLIDRAQSPLFKIEHAGKKNLRVSGNEKNFRKANLVVTEGDNSHLFILEYKESLDAAVENEYDFSSRDKLNAEIQNVKMVLNNSSAREAFGKSNTYIPEFSSANSTPTNLTGSAPEANNTEEPASVKLSNETSNASKLEKPVLKNDSKTATNKPANTNVAKREEKKVVAEKTELKKPAPENTEPKQSAAEKPETKQTSIPVSKPLQTTPPTPNIVPTSNTSTTASSSAASSPEETSATQAYDHLIHLGDSTAWIAKDFKGSLRWYDSARRVNVQASYPYKQMAAVKQMLNEQAIAAKKQRSAKFQAALPEYKSADALRVERKFEEAYSGYGKFLAQLDSTSFHEYLPSEIYYINQAKDYMVRLQPHLPKPKPVTAPPPAEDKKKKKKRRG